MCLHIKSSFVAEKHIFVYKVGQKSNEHIITCFQESLLPFNKLIIDPAFQKYRHHYLLSAPNGYSVNNGYYHAFTSLEKARSCGINNSSIFGYMIVFLAIIPEGSVGFYGKDNDICANKMIFLNPDAPDFKEICSQYGITDYEYHKLLSS